MLTMRHRTILTGSAASAACLAAPHIARAQARRLRLGHNNNTQTVAHASVEAFAAAVQERSDGRLRIEIFPNAALGNEKQTLKAVFDGALDMTLAPVGVAGAYSKLTGLIELPYLFRDAAHARQALDGALGKACAEELVKSQIVVLGWTEVGIRQMTANKPIRTVADLQGLKLRVPLSEPILETFRALGATADALPFAQLIEALRTGRFDAQENPINVIVGNKLNTVQSHLSLSRHAYTAFLLSISGDVLEELPAADRAVLAASAPAGVTASRSWADRVEADGLAKLRAAGMTIFEDIDRASFRDAAGAAGDRLAKLFGADALKTVRTLTA